MTYRALSPPARLYICAVCVCGAVVIATSARDLYVHPIGWRWLLLAVLTLISGSATVRLPSVPATISISETFVFTAVLLFGPSAGTLTVALDALVISIWLAWRGHPFYRLLFNVCALPASLWVAAHVYYWIGDVPPLYLSPQGVEIVRLLVPLLLFTIAYFLLNSWLIAVAISLEKQNSPLRIWKDNFARLVPNYFAGASVAALLITYTRNIDYAYLAFGLPLLAIIYFTFSTSLGRVADAHQHLKELNTLYLSTIETLAMAIDAKDQITHGHIRRVQTFAIRLAEELGVKDESQIRAIEAASLLHDMGKLAVPEYILNKPGPLTPAEFDKMKLHASAGADILSSIAFPYPVVPIVRHHHENWDGTGYPDGLRGSEIPIGARILSVVDCFDALTSDRPYRPRLSDGQALQILIDRRGVMYDPLVVDAFIRLHARMAAQLADSNPTPREALATITGNQTTHTPTSTGLEDIAASTEESLILYELARDLSPRRGVEDVLPVLSRHLRRLVPVTTTVLYLYAQDSDELVLSAADGEHAEHLSGLRIPRGQRLSGWVAANKQTIINSDAALDLGETARSLMPRLRSCLSTPLYTKSGIVGVLTLYSTKQFAFIEDHGRIVASVAQQVARALDHNSTRDAIVGRTPLSLPAGLSSNLERVFASLGASQAPLSLAVIEAHSRGDRQLGSPTAMDDLALTTLREHLAEILRNSDLLFELGSGKFLALLPRADADAANAFARRLLQLASTLERGLSTTKFRLSIGTATSPHDGTGFRELLEQAETRATGAQSVTRFPSVH